MKRLVMKGVEAQKRTEPEREVVSVAPMTFNTLYDKAYFINVHSEDYVVPDFSKTFVSFKSELNNQLNFHFDGSDLHRNLTPHSLGQFCARLGVPVSYINSLSERGIFTLIDRNISSLAILNKKATMIRCYDQTVRGFLSSQYKVFDTLSILEVLSEVSHLDDFVIKGYFLTPERFHLRLVSSEMLPIKGEDLFFGIQLDSSDVGRSTLVLRTFIYKRVCTNGLTIPLESSILFKQRHIGGLEKDTLYKGLIEGIKRIPDVRETYMDILKNVTKDTIVYFEGLTYEDIIDKIRKQTSLSDTMANQVLSLMDTKYSLNRLGYAHALTEVSQSLTLEKRLTLEKIAGGVLIAR